MNNERKNRLIKTKTVIDDGKIADIYREQGEIRNNIYGFLSIRHFIRDYVASPNSIFSRSLQLLGDARRNDAYDAIVDHQFLDDEEFKGQYNNLLDASVEREELERRIILNYLEQGLTFGLADYEIAVLKTSCHVGHLYDDLGRSIRSDYTVMESDPVKQLIKDKKMNNPYSLVVDKGNGEYEEQLFNVRNRNIVDGIIKHWRVLLESPFMQNVTINEIKAMREFYLKYIDALECRDLNQAEQSWKEVDMAFMDVKGRLQPIPGREDIYIPGKIFPDFRLCIHLEDYANPIELKKAILDFMQKRYGSCKSCKETLGLLDKTDMYAKYELVWAGRSLDFPLSGQALPNDIEVKKKKGVKTYVDPAIISDRGERARYLMGGLFPFQAVWLRNYSPAEEGSTIVGGHELSEELLETLRSITHYPKEIWKNLNEDRAYLIVTGAIFNMFNKGLIYPEKLYGYVYYLMGLSFRYIYTASNNDMLKPYYIMSMLIVKRLLESGFIHQIKPEWLAEKGIIRDGPSVVRQLRDEGYCVSDNGIWSIKMNYLGSIPVQDMKTLKRFFKVSMKDLDKQLDLMDNPNTKKAQEYLDQLKDPKFTEQAKDIYTILFNTKYEDWHSSA